MTALLRWEDSYGGTAAWGSIAEATLRFKAADNNDQDTLNPLVRPTSGANYSYEKFTRVTVQTLPASQISDLRILLSDYVRDNAGNTLGLTFQYEFRSSYGSGPVQPTTDGARLTMGTSPITWNNGSLFGGAQYDPWGDNAILVIKIASTVGAGGLLGSGGSGFTIIARYNEI